MSSEPNPATGPPRPHRPGGLVLALMATAGLATSRPPIPSRVLVEVLAELGINEGAARRTLSRMVKGDLLVREVAGRTTSFRPSERARTMLLAGWERVSEPSPFDRGDGLWTLLAFSIPESKRDLRHQLRARLLWAGLGPLRDGLWIGPGVVDVPALLSDLPFGVTNGDQPWAFAAQPRPPTELGRLIHRVWDVEGIRAEHDRFLYRWSPAPAMALSPIATLTLLVADWLRLLRTDPGLPTAYLGSDWPADLSAKAYLTLSDRYRPMALKELDAALKVPRRKAPGTGR